MAGQSDATIVNSVWAYKKPESAESMEQPPDVGITSVVPRNTAVWEASV